MRDGKLLSLQLMLCSRLDELLQKLDVKLNQNNKMYYGQCPIHCGDNNSALNIYKSGKEIPGIWLCHTKHCENIFKKTIIGFVRGVLSRNNGWDQDRNSTKIVSFNKVISWCCDFLGIDFDNIEIDKKEIEKNEFYNRIEKITKKIQQESKITRNQVIKHLTFPAQYFIDRGWSKEILNKYDVGFCDNPSKPFYKRCVVPVYDNAHKFAVGFTARSIYEKCEKCFSYHDKESNCVSYPKWKNSESFDKDCYLYNYWFANKHILNTGKVLLTEGPGEVWRLEECGIKNSLAMFGVHLSDQQQIILETSGAIHVVLLTNNDEAGISGREEIRNKLKRSFHVYTPELEKNDLGCMSKDEVLKLLSSIRYR